MKKALLLTFDYELFLGARSGGARECVLDPTDATLEILNRHHARGIFFVDTTWLLRLRETSHARAQADFVVVADQLRRMAADGHEVFPHIHPHWLDAVYLESRNEWELSNPSRYRFHCCTMQERAVLFDASVNLLKEIITPAVPGYAPDCFRAGGWCIQPFCDFKPLFEKHKIRYDMTVLGGFYAFTDAQYFDFTKWPGKNVYRFDDDICIESPDGPFTEFAITSVRPGAFSRLADRFWQKADAHLYAEQAWLRGKGYPSEPVQPVKKSAAPGQDVLQPGRERIAVELLSPVRLSLYRKFLEANDYMHFISHPKMITGRQLRLFDRFLSCASRFNPETDFRKIADHQMPGT